MFMLRSTHDRVIHHKNAAALGVIGKLREALGDAKKLVDEQTVLIEHQRNTIRCQQDVIEERNREIASLRRSAALDKLAEIDAEEIKDP